MSCSRHFRNVLNLKQLYFDLGILLSLKPEKLPKSEQLFWFGECRIQMPLICSGVLQINDIRPICLPAIEVFTTVFVAYDYENTVLQAYNDLYLALYLENIII